MDNINHRHLTVKEAYQAMYNYLQRMCEESGSDDIAELLSNMALLPDGEPANPGIWQDWIDAITETHES